MIDIDLKDFRLKDKLDRALNRILRRIESKMRGYPTVIWTGNGYHIYQPMAGFILEQEEVFTKFIDLLEKISQLNLCNLLRNSLPTRKEIGNIGHP